MFLPRKKFIFDGKHGFFLREVPWISFRYAWSWIKKYKNFSPCFYKKRLFPDPVANIHYPHPQHSDNECRIKPCLAGWKSRSCCVSSTGTMTARKLKRYHHTTPPSASIGPAGTISPEDRRNTITPTAMRWSILVKALFWRCNRAPPSEEFLSAPRMCRLMESRGRLWGISGGTVPGVNVAKRFYHASLHPWMIPLNWTR